MRFDGGGRLKMLVGLAALIGSACTEKRELECGCPTTLEEYCGSHDCPDNPAEALDLHLISLKMTRENVTIVGAAGLLASVFYYFEDDRLVGYAAGDDLVTECTAQCPFTLGQLPVDDEFARRCYLSGQCEDFEVCTISGWYDSIGRVLAEEYDAGQVQTPACPGHAYFDPDATDAAVPAETPLDIPSETDPDTLTTDLDAGLCVQLADGGWGASACEQCPSPPMVDNFVSLEGSCAPLTQCLYDDHSCGAVTECRCRNLGWSCSRQECL